MSRPHEIYSLFSIFSPLFFSAALCFCSIATYAQRNEILSPNIATLQVVAGEDWLSMPVIELNGEKHINISFDELSHSYHRFSYSIQHCEADWMPSADLLESDVVDGFATGNTIDDTEQSVNTNTVYTHYKLQIPNEHCRLKLSGNYTVTVFDEDNGNLPVLKACFMVVEKMMTVGLEVTTNTDIDINKSHQQVNMTLNFGNTRVTKPSEQIKTVVMQNYRWDNAVVNIKPQYVRADGLVWSHCKDFIFPAGNEYRKFEILDPTHTTMGLENVGWNGKQYQAWLFVDEPRPSYIYDEDANGAFCIRNSDNIDNDTESDYIFTYFRLRTSRQNGDIYLNGVWTNDRFMPQYKMAYNENDGLYEAVIPLKQGYYSYQYLLMQSDGTTIPLPSEGSFYQTENTYQALVYYRGQGGRSDRLVGYSTTDAGADGTDISYQTPPLPY